MVLQHFLGKEMLVPRAIEHAQPEARSLQFLPWRTVSCAYQYASSTQPHSKQGVSLAVVSYSNRHRRVGRYRTRLTVRADHLASLICRIPEKPTGAASIPAVSQPYHAFPAPDGSRGSPKDISLVDFVFARTTRESVGHRRTRHRHGSGP